MQSKKFVFPLLLLTLTLAGCQGKSEDPSKVLSEDPTSTPVEDVTSTEESSAVEDVTSTEESSAQVSTSIDMIEEGYTLAEGWPKVAIDGYLEGLGVEERVPAFTTEKETYYAIYEDPFFFQQLITEVAILDTTMETTTALHDFLAAEGWTNTSNLEEEYIQFYNRNETIAVMGGNYAGDEEFPAMSLFYIAGFVNKAPLEGYETTKGWPETIINEYLAGFGITDVTVPALNVTDEAFVKLVDDDPNFDPYLSLVVPGGNRVEEYKGILTAGGFPVEADDEDPDYFYAENAAQNVLVEFYYDEAEGGYPEGMYIFVSGFGTQQGGEVEEPSNPESAKVISLRDESYMQGERNGEKTTWGLEGLKMEVTKNTSTVNVGNLIPSQPDKHFFSNPLRVYAGQKVTFTATEQIEQVHLEFDTAHASSLESIIASVPEGVNYAVEDNIFVIAANSNTLEFSFVAAAQFRVFSVTVYTNKA